MFGEMVEHTISYRDMKSENIVVRVPCIDYTLEASKALMLSFLPSQYHLVSEPLIQPGSTIVRRQDMLTAEECEESCRSLSGLLLLQAPYHEVTGPAP